MHTYVTDVLHCNGQMAPVFSVTIGRECDILETPLPQQIAKHLVLKRHLVAFTSRLYVKTSVLLI